MLVDRTPARRRLEWVLAGLDGTPGWGADAAEVLAPEYLDAVPAEVFLRRTRERARSYGPLVLVGGDLGAHTARARVRTGGGEVLVVGCVVEPEPPGRIVNTWVLDEVPRFLTPRLPLHFPPPAAGAARTGASLVVLSGVPGTGKSTLADAVGRATGTPVFSADWLLGALTPYGGYHLADLLGIAEELLTTLAYRELGAGRSAILDAPGEDVATRERWRSLAAASGAELRVVVCVCSDPALHRRRVEERSRAIPGWHDAGDWQDVERRLAAFPPWAGDALTVDATRPLAHNVEAVLAYLAR